MFFEAQITHIKISFPLLSLVTCIRQVSWSSATSCLHFFPFVSFLRCFCLFSLFYFFVFPSSFIQRGKECQNRLVVNSIASRVKYSALPYKAEFAKLGIKWKCRALCVQTIKNFNTVTSKHETKCGTFLTTRLVWLHRSLPTKPALLSHAVWLGNVTLKSLSLLIFKLKTKIVLIKQEWWNDIWC